MKLETSFVKKGRKFDQVLDGAREVFMRDGFDGANVDMIAKVAGVSKATLYSYFPDKRLLFMEVAKQECTRQAAAAINRMQMAGDVRVVLYEAASHLVRFFLSRFGQQTFRIAVGESERFPEIGRAFYQSGPAMAEQALIRFLETQVSAGTLVIEDMDLAAGQFIELCKATLHTKLAMGIRSDFPDSEVERVIHGAVDTFMARYGAPCPA